MKSLLFVALFIFCQNALTQQSPGSTDTPHTDHSIPTQMDSQHRCATDHARTQWMGMHPQLLQKELLMNEAIRTFQTQSVGNRDDEDRYISVVVHIIHQNGEENISDAQVQQGIDDLNSAFSNLGAYQSSNGVDTHLRFCLAQQDEDGLPTTGITRHESALTYTVMEYNDIQLKDIVRWDPSRYLNIWLVSEIVSSGLGTGVAGYAFLPYAHGMPEDGIVNEARWFGSSTDHSKVHIHEVGHYLGLYHTFEGGCANDDCTVNGDHVCDTPPDASTDYSSCGIAQNSCVTDIDDLSSDNPFRPIGSGGLGDQNDLIQNFMDYSEQICQTLFTEGQSVRMNAVLSEERESLLNSSGCMTSCGIGPVNILEVETQFLAGENFNLSQNSPAIFTVNYSWTFLNEELASTHDLNYTFSNGQIGEGYLYLTVINPELGCSRSDSIFIHVQCNPPASFSMLPHYADVNEVITFDGTNELADTYQWYLDGNLIGQNPVLTYTFTASEGHRIYLVTGNGSCTDTSAIDYFAVGQCSGGQNNHWIIGGGSGVHIDFTSGTPEVSLVENTDENWLQGGEGLSTISDQNGELLLYSDGNKIFNRNHEVMFSGLGASWSSTQGVMIVPDPASDHEYYVFSLENFAGYGPGSYASGTGFSYIKIDMNLNGGLGLPSTGLIQLLDRATEKMTCVRHCNGHDIWVISHGYHNNWYYSYLLTDEGISEPVISPVGVMISDFNGTAGIGYLKPSPQGDLLIAGHDYLGLTEFFHFDSNTGILTDDMQQLNLYLYYGAYGTAFSPDGSKAYYVNEYDANIHQIDLSSGNQTMMINSMMTIGTSLRPYYLGAIELGPDGKLYIAQSSGTHLDVIHHPNEAGLACGFQTNALAVPSAAYGLNNILADSRIAATPHITGITQVCTNSVGVPYSASCGSNNWVYSGTGTLHILSETDVILDFATPGTDTLFCSRYDACLGNLSDTLIIHVGTTHLSLGDDISMCSTGSVTLYAPSQYQSYLWSNGAQTQNITVSNSGNYWVKATALGGCIARDTIHISVFNEPFDVTSYNVEVCNDAPSNIFLNATLGDFTHHWISLNGPQNNVLQASFYPENYNAPWQFPIYYVNDHGCVDEDTILAIMRPDLPEFILDDLVLCPGEIYVMELDPTIRCSYTWLDGSHANPYTIYTTENTSYAGFSVNRYDSICNTWAGDYFLVNTPLPQGLMLNDSLLICEGSQVELFAGWSFDNYEWQDGSVDTTLTVTEAGTYWVNTQTPCGVYSDTTVVKYIDMSSFQIGLPDTIPVCSSQLPVALTGINNYLYNYSWSNGYYGLVFEEGELTVSAYNNCGIVYDTTFIEVTNSALDLIPPLVFTCDSSSMILTQPEDQITIWENDIVSDSLIVYQSGIYHFNTSIGNACSVIDSVTVIISDLYFHVNDTTLCEGDTLQFIPATNAEYWFWLSPDPTTIISISDTGQYYFIASDNYCTKPYEISVHFSNFEYSLVLPDSLFACPDQLPQSLSASGDVAIQYEWSNGSELQNIEVQDEGWYFLHAVFDCAEKQDSTFLSILNLPSIDLPSDTLLCADEEIVLFADDDADNIWSTGENSNSIIIDEAGTYGLTSTSTDGCSTSRSIQVLASDLYIDLDPEMNICPNDSVLISAITNGIINHWNTGSTSNSIYATEQGTYVFNASLDHCSMSKEINVFEWPDHSFYLGNDTSLVSESFTINAPSGYNVYDWNVGGQSNQELVVENSGTYSLTVEDENGCVYTDEMVVVLEKKSSDSYIEVPDFFYFGNNLTAKYQNVVVYDVKIFDAIGKLVSYGNNFPTVWDGKVNGNESSSAVYYYIINYSDMDGRKKILKGNVLCVR